MFPPAPEGVRRWADRRPSCPHPLFSLGKKLGIDGPGDGTNRARAVLNQSVLRDLPVVVVESTYCLHSRGFVATWSGPKD